VIERRDEAKAFEPEFLGAPDGFQEVEGRSEQERVWIKKLRWSTRWPENLIWQGSCASAKAGQRRNEASIASRRNGFFWTLPRSKSPSPLGTSRTPPKRTNVSAGSWSVTESATSRDTDGIPFNFGAQCGFQGSASDQVHWDSQRIFEKELEVHKAVEGR